MIRRLRLIEEERGQSPMPAAALTTHAGAEDQDRALAAGFDAFIPQPFDSERLVRLVRDLAAAPRR